MLPKAGGSWLIWTEVAVLVPDWSVLMQMRSPNPHSFIGPIGTVSEIIFFKDARNKTKNRGPLFLIGQNKVTGCLELSSSN